jgi:glycosyltransferase involved in cell wall biosynthesis
MDNALNKEISIVVPVYNEAGCLYRNMGILVACLEELAVPWEVVLVDDGSTDETGNIGRQLAAEFKGTRLEGYAVNRGKGYAVKTGMLKACGKFRLFTDADLAVPVEFIGRCLQRFRQGDDIVIGSRHLKESVYKIPEGAVRTFLGRVYRKLTLEVFGLSVSDITCGLKGFSARATEAVFSRAKVDRWGYDAEILFIAEKLGYQIREIPVDWYHSFDSNVRLGLDVPRTFSEMLMIWMNYRKGLYRL